MHTRLWRLLALLLAAVLVASACGDDADTSDTGTAAADTAAADPVETPDDDAMDDTASDVDSDDGMGEDPADDAAADDSAGDDTDDMSDEAAEDDMDDMVCSEVHDVVAATVNPNDLLNYALQNGLFEAECLNVTLAEGLNGPGIVTGLAAGEIDFGFVAAVPVATAVTNAAQPIQIASVRTAAVEGNDHLVLIANPASGISSPADFAGKNIGIRSPGSLCTVVIKQAMINAGIDDPNSAATYVQGESNGDLKEKLFAGDIDATCFTYPFAGGVVGDNAVIIGSTLSAYPDGIPVGVTAVSDEFAAEHADLVEHWNAALRASAAYANEDEARWRALLPDITSMSPEQAAASVLSLNVGGGPVTDWDFGPIFATVEALGLTDGPVDVENVFD